MSKTKFYDGTKILNLLDINKQKPEVYFITTNRSAGKTTFFARYMVKRFIKHNEKFMLLYRYSYELDGVAEKFFKDVQGLFFPNYIMSQKSHKQYTELFIQKIGSDQLISCGYAVALNAAESIKKLSHLFSDTARMFMDEFQSETNRYCSNEIEKFQSIHTSIARGQGAHVRYVPVIMCGNAITLLNPYFIAYGVANRLKADTKFLRGEGFVLESGYVESAALAQSTSAFNRALKDSKYVAYSTQNIYLHDNYAFVEKPTGKGTYRATIKYLEKNYSIVEYPKEGVVYVSNTFDKTFPIRISVTTNDHNINYVMLNQYAWLIKVMRWYFEKGCMRFKNLECRNALLSMIKY